MKNFSSGQIPKEGPSALTMDDVGVRKFGHPQGQHCRNSFCSHNHKIFHLLYWVAYIVCCMYGRKFGFPTALVCRTTLRENKSHFSLVEKILHHNRHRWQEIVPRNKKLSLQFCVYYAWGLHPSWKGCKPGS